MSRTEKQLRAIERNWRKAQIVNAVWLLRKTNTEQTREEELRCRYAADVLNVILKGWDRNSLELGFKVRPKKGD